MKKAAARRSFSFARCSLCLSYSTLRTSERMERDNCPGSRVVSTAAVNRVGSGERRQPQTGHSMLDDHRAVLSRLFGQPFTSAFLDAVLEHDYDTHRHL